MTDRAEAGPLPPGAIVRVEHPRNVVVRVRVPPLQEVAEVAASANACTRYRT